MTLARLTAGLIRLHRGPRRARAPKPARPSRHLALICLAMSFAGGTYSAARAQTVGQDYDFYFSYSYSGPGSINASGELFTTYDGGGIYTVNNITGSRNGVAVTDLAPANAAGLNSDNLLYYPASSLAGTSLPYGGSPPGGSAFVDLGGVSYYIGSTIYNIGWINGSNNYTSIPGYGEQLQSLAVTPLDYFNVSAAPGPTPGAGLLSLAFFVLAGVKTKARAIAAFVRDFLARGGIASGRPHESPHF